MPPDRSQELSRATEALDQARHYCRPGSLTRARREDRRRLEEAEARYAAACSEQGRREDWLAEHGELLAYRDQLTAAVTEPRNELGFRVAIASPEHLLRVIGPVPASAEAIRLWTSMAGRIESYREEWGVEPDRLRERPHDVVQEEAWEAAVRSAELLSRVATRAQERSLDHGRELG